MSARVLIADQLSARFIEGESDAVYLVYSSFRSAISQVPTIVPLLPVALPEPAEGAAPGVEYIFEPPQKALLGELLPAYLRTVILQALLENPGELEKLRRRPELVESAVEEIVRWTSPVIQFCRTATEDVELRGRKIRAGQNLCLFYPSANRDEEVFADPFAFRVDRRPNPHLAFGIGEHFCLGANLARLELRVAFRALATRLRHVELAGPVERLRSSFVGGIKRVPIRYELA